jgi:hypothetical protein
VKFMLWCKLKLWHLMFYHNESPPKNPHFNGCKRFHVTCETCVMMQIKIVIFKFLSQKRKKIMSHVKFMSWCKLKLWHLKFHHNESPQKHCHFNGCNVSCIGNKCNMLCANGYTYVVMLIMDNKWKNHHNLFWFGSEAFCQVFEFLIT